MARRVSQQEQEELSEASSQVSLDLSALLTWGQNAYGELCHGDLEERKQPELVAFVRQKGLRVKQVVAGNEHTAVLTEDGQVFCCGYNDSGQCGVGHTQRVHTLQLVEALEGKGVVQIFSANGCEHILAVTEAGALYAWGYNSRGQLGLATSHATIPEQILSLQSKQVVKVACSYYHTVISTNEDELFAFGRNDNGQLGVGDKVDRESPERVKGLPQGMILSIACGQYHSVFSIDCAGVYSCGKNDYGQLGVIAFDPPQVPVPVSAPLDACGHTVTNLSCGYYHTVALTESGEVFSWGRNDHGQLGLGNTTNTNKPTQIQTLPPKAVGISSGCYHTLILMDDGKVFAQGRSNHGQLGVPGGDDIAVPVRINALSPYKVSSIAAGFYHSACLTESLNPSPLATASNLSSDLRKMLNNSARSDVEFLVEGKTIFAHRCIVIARCEPLAKMLEGPMRESSEMVVPLPGLQYHIVLGLLEFLYTDSVAALDSRNVDLNYALDLLALADQYLVERLKNLCEVAIQKSVTVENVAVMFKTADERQAHALRRRCFEYILKHFGKVIGTDGFLLLNNTLLREVLFAASERGVTVRPT